MAMSYYNISLYHFADHLIYLPSSSSFWFSLNSSYEHDFQFLLELTLSEPLTLDKEVRMQEEWHCDERKCTFVLLAHNLLLLDLDISDDDWPCVAVASPLHIPLPLRCRFTVDCHCPRAVHCCCCRCINNVPSIAITIAPSIAVALAMTPSINIINIALQVCHSSSSLPPRCR